jgi:hypothetical protein
MTNSLGPLFDKTSLDQKIEALKKDLLAEDGPQISTMRNYRFAILPYDPEEEFKLRVAIRHLSDDLKSSGWQVLSISLQGLLLHRLKQEDQPLQQRIMETERRLYTKNPDRALTHLKDKISPHIEGLEGVAKDVIALIDDFVENHPDEVNQTVIFIGRTGALYPFFRSSSLLKHLDGKTRNLPVILLYPGKREGMSALSFMGEMPADRDYRPRIYS